MNRYFNHQLSRSNNKNFSNPSFILSLFILLRQTRLEQLFSVRQMFTEGELLPYFLDMIGQKGKPGSVAELLLPHTRLIDDNYLRK